MCSSDLFAGLQGGNNLAAKPTTIENVESITGESETFIVQTIRSEWTKTIIKGFEETKVVERGFYVVIKYVDKEGTKRLILPPKVADTLLRQRESLTNRNRSNSSKRAMRERMANGWTPKFDKKLKSGGDADERS